MNMYRKFGISALILMMILSMTGCSSSSSAAEETSESPDAAVTEAASENSTENDSEKDSADESENADAGESAVQDDEDVFVFTRDNFPVMDGSTSLAPLGEAVASVLLGETRDEVQDLVSFNKTTQSYRNLMNGECQLLLASEPNSVVFDEMKDIGFECEMEPISTEALVFVVNSDNPVDDLTTEQIQKIYSGEITNWSEVGGEDLEIKAFQRNSGAGSQALMEKLVMGDITMMEAPEEMMISSMGELMESVKSYDNSADAIGYSVYYYANDMKMADGLKIISVDGVEPSDETIRSGEYPHTNAYYCAVSAAEPEDSPARILYDWMVSEDGQKLVAEEGYVSVLDVK